MFSLIIHLIYIYIYYFFRRNIQAINSIVEHLTFLDKHVEVTKTILEHGLELEFVVKRNAQKFYSRLIEKLVNDEKAKEATDLLKFCIAKEFGELNEDLIKIVDNSKLKSNEK